MNYPVLIIVIILITVLIIYLIKRNLKDKKNFEDEVIESEIPPTNDDQENI